MIESTQSKERMTIQVVLSFTSEEMYNLKQYKKSPNEPINQTIERALKRLLRAEYEV